MKYVEKRSFHFSQSRNFKYFSRRKYSNYSISDGVLTVKQKLAYHLDKKDEHRKLKVHNTREELV